jgi:histidinol-phosphate aminotransferase
MPVSRRNVLRRFGVTAIAGTAAHSLGGLSFADSLGLRPSADERPRSGPILLDRNENAYGPSEKVLAALRDATSVSNRYARTEYDALASKIAALHALKPEQIVITCGSSQILRLAAAQFLGPGKKLVQAAPTFPLLGKAARSEGTEVVDVPLTKTGEHDLNGMLTRAGDSAGLVYICNPNNPTGTLTPRKDIETFVRKLPARTMVLIDEAYHHFAKPNGAYVSFLDQPLDDPRLIVVRTFSKIYGLAGMRVGYMVATAEIARRFAGHQLNLGISVVAARGAAAALDDIEYVELGIKRNTDDRQEFMNQVNARFIHALDSHTNFVMLNPLRDRNKVVTHLKDNGIFIAPIFPAMPNYVRVSLGTPPDMEEFWRVLDELPVTEKTHMSHM